jgi:hypothetical protein
MVASSAKVEGREPESAIMTAPYHRGGRTTPGRVGVRARVGRRTDARPQRSGGAEPRCGPGPRTRWYGPGRVLHFAVTIFLSAFLLFQVQPLIGKIILPWFGGTPAVWTTCMLFFQVLLLGGYAYAHYSTDRLSPRRQGLVHIGLLIAALLATAPTILPGDAWKPEGDASPLLAILVMLAVCVGLPYFALSATGSLVQAWFARTYPGRSPYALYALSNIGSLLGLLTFPFVVEPNIGSTTQASAWFWAFAAFAVLCGGVAVRAMRATPQARRVDDGGDAPPPSLGLRAVWTGLAACASTMLLAITNQMAIDVASVPFLWVVPLSLYLLSFILCFGSERWYPRVLFYPLLLAAYVGVIGLMLAGAGAALEVQVGVYSASLFVFCMVCHGELYRLRPHPRHLTSFYLALSLGGALGGILVGLVAPTVFPMYYELHLCLLATAALVFYAFYRDPRLEVGGRVLRVGIAVRVRDHGRGRDLHGEGRLVRVHGDGAAARGGAAGAGVRGAVGGRDHAAMPRGRLAWMLPPVAIGLIGVNLGIEAMRRSADAVAISRGFFGMLRVVDRDTRRPDAGAADPLSRGDQPRVPVPRDGSADVAQLVLRAGERDRRGADAAPEPRGPHGRCASACWGSAAARC